MNRAVTQQILTAALLAGTIAAAGCGAADGKAKDRPAAPAAIAIAATAATERPLARFIRATGTLMAEEQADVAAETAGRVIATPVERGTKVTKGAVLIRLSDAETGAQAKEAEANAGQIEARLGITPAAPFDVDKVPEVQSAKASLDLAQSEFNRIRSLLDQRVVSQSEFEQRRTQLEAARQQYESAKNGAAQMFQSLLAARARVTLARQARADTAVRAPISGIVAERLASVGDYVNKGMKVAVVVRVDPLRVQLTVPEQFVSSIGVGQTVSFVVDAYPGRTFEGTVRYVSPALEANQRALTLEAVVANENGDLKPGLFATARIEEKDKTPAIIVPAAAVLTVAGTSRVYVLTGDHVEERIVTIGQALEGEIEITSGLKAGERVATRNVAQLGDGTKVS